MLRKQISKGPRIKIRLEIDFCEPEGSALHGYWAKDFTGESLQTIMQVISFFEDLMEAESGDNANILA